MFDAAALNKLLRCIVHPHHITEVLKGLEPERCSRLPVDQFDMVGVVYRYASFLGMSLRTRAR